MSEEILIRQCDPTLAGIKTGSLFPCPYGDVPGLLQDLRELNRRIVPKGLCLLPLCWQSHRALLYLFRPRALERDLRGEETARLLEAAGYPSRRSGACLGQLMQRLREKKDFPHEIGLFLSYPPEDVKGFIENRAAKSKCTGHWKVYGDERRTRALFEKYDRCTRIYWDLWQAGHTLDTLIVET